MAEPDTEREMKEAVAKAKRETAELIGGAVIRQWDVRKAGESLMAIYDPELMPPDIADACARLMIWCAARANAERAPILRAATAE